MKKRKRPRLRRGWKVVLNFTLAAVLFVLFWGVLDYPLNSKVCNFRRAERMDWVGPSEIQRIGGGHFGVVGTYLDQVVIQTGRDNLDYWPRNPDSPTLTPLDGDILAVDVPEGNVRAELTLELSFYYYPALAGPEDVGPTYPSLERAAQDYDGKYRAEFWQNTYTVQGECLEEGGVIFPVSGQAGRDRRPLHEAASREGYLNPDLLWAQARMSAVFYGENGQELGRAELATPEETGNAAG